MEHELWVPSHAGSKEQKKVEKALYEYDDKLVLTRHFYTNDWVVCITLDNGNLYPVIGLGQSLPDPIAMREMLQKADTRRKGNRMLEEINKNNEAIRQKYRDKADQGAGQAAEALEWGFRKKTGDGSKIFVPRGI